jgi:hypothetical protein
MAPKSLTHEQYAALPGINASAIKRGSVSMKHMRHYLTDRDDRDSPALRWGRIVHLAILEPDRFASVSSVYDGRRAGGKWEAHIDAHEKEWTLKPEEMASIMKMTAAVYSEPEAARLIRESRHEVALQWTGGYGAGKCRVDGLGDGWFFDLKTAAPGEYASFERAYCKYGYDLQMGWYSEGSKSEGAFVIVLEKEKPYDVMVKQVMHDTLKDGRDRAVEIAMRYRAHELSGYFPGVSPGVTPLELPVWAGNENAEVIMEGLDNE